MTGNTTRRQFLTGTVAVGSALGGIALLGNSVSATAEIQTAEFQIPDASHTLVDSEIADVVLSADISYGWDANVDVTRAELTLSVGFKPETAEVIARHERDGMSKQSLSQAQTLQASVLNSSDLDAQLFMPAGDKGSVDFVAIVELLLFRDGEVLATDAMQQQVTVTITDEEIQLNGTLDGSGNVTIQEA